MKVCEMTNEQIADTIERAYCASSSEFGLTMREAAARLLKIDDYAEMCADTMREVAALRAKLKVAEEVLVKISKDDLCGHREQAARALSDIRAEGGESIGSASTSERTSANGND